MTLLYVPALEVNIVEHCNLRCAHCDHLAPLMPHYEIAPEECLSVLTTLGGVLHARELRVIGGEPLLHSRLAEVVRSCSLSGIADVIVLWTNGLLLKEMPETVWEMIHGVVVSIYPDVRLPYDTASLQPLIDRYGVWVSKRRCPEFMQGNAVIRNSNDHLVQMIYDTCSETHTQNCHTVRKGYYYRCVQAAYAPARLLHYGITTHDSEEDGICILNNATLAHDLCLYLRSRHPLKACAYCLGDHGRWVPHQHSDCDEGRVEKGEVPDLLSPDFMVPTSMRECHRST